MDKKHSSLLVLVTGLLLFLPACLRKINVASRSLADAEALKDGFAPASKFFVKCTKDTNISLLHRELKNKISKYLKKAGFCVVQDEKEADYLLVFALKMESETKISHTPVYNPTFISSSGETITVDNWSYLPKSYTLFSQALGVSVLNKSPGYPVVWEGYAAHSSEEYNPREVLDYLILALAKDFGRDSKKTIDTAFTESDLESFWGEKKIKKSKKKRTSK